MNMENKYIAGIDPIENLPDSTSVTYSFTLPSIQTITIQTNPLLDNTSTTLLPLPVSSRTFPISSGTTLMLSGTIYMDMSTGTLNYATYEKDYSNLTTLGLIEECLTLIDKL